MSDLLVRHGPKLAVGGLVLLNLVLIGALVLRDSVRTTFPAEPVPASSPSVTVSPTPTSTGRATETSTSAVTSLTPGPTPPEAGSATPSPSESRGEPGGKTYPQPRLLAANSGRVAWRAESTGCQGTAVVEVTTNVGRSWSKTNPGLTAIVGLRAYGGNGVLAIGADDKCRPTYAWSTGPGQTWRRDQRQVRSLWYRSPDNLDEVHAPSGRKSKPCGDALVDLAGLGTYQAAVLCTDGRIRTNAAGRPWRTVQMKSGVVSLNADDDRYVSVGTSRTCDGVVARRFDSSGNGLGAARKCRSDVTTGAGVLAVSTRGKYLWLWSGTRVLRY